LEKIWISSALAMLLEQERALEMSEIVLETHFCKVWNVPTPLHLAANYPQEQVSSAPREKWISFALEMLLKATGTHFCQPWNSPSHLYPSAHKLAEQAAWERPLISFARVMANAYA